jgi:hypothetical protein
MAIKQNPAHHLTAAARHLKAAENHDRAAEFWEDQGDHDRAALQHEMAHYERRGGELEQGWAGLIERDGTLQH